MSDAGRCYLAIDPRVGYPAGPGLFLECRRCGEILPSMPEVSLACRCRNVRIDVDCGRIAVDNDCKVAVFAVDARIKDPGGGANS